MCIVDVADCDVIITRVTLSLRVLNANDLILYYSGGRPFWHLLSIVLYCTLLSLQYYSTLSKLS